MSGQSVDVAVGNAFHEDKAGLAASWSVSVRIQAGTGPGQIAVRYGSGLPRKWSAPSRSHPGYGPLASNPRDLSKRRTAHHALLAVEEHVEMGNKGHQRISRGLTVRIIGKDRSRA